MANDGARVLSYDVYNRLLSVTGTGVNLKLIYDPEGRLAKYSTDGGTKYQTYLYDGTNLIGEYSAKGSLQRRYVHGTGVDEPLVWYEGANLKTKRFFVQNYQGSVIGYTDASGNLSELYKYGPYGEPKNAANTESWTGSRFRYTGQTMIAKAKLYYYKARVYDPVYGRFLQTDPIGGDDDLDLYAYVGGDPINKIDPTGEDSYLVYRPVKKYGVELSKHAFVVVTNDKGEVLQRFSYGPSKDGDGGDFGQLVSLTGTDTETNTDDDLAWSNRGKAVTVVNLTDKGYKDADVLASGRNMDRALGTRDNPGTTKYKAIPNGKLGNGNSNSAAMAVVNGAQSNSSKPIERPKGVTAIGDEQNGKIRRRPPPLLKCTSGRRRSC
jgi:RHS repeat-associated protein